MRVKIVRRLVGVDYSSELEEGCVLDVAGEYAPNTKYAGYWVRLLSGKAVMLFPFEVEVVSWTT